jgi:hypothetical protein
MLVVGHDTYCMEHGNFLLGGGWAVLVVVIQKFASGLSVRTVPDIL